MENKLAGDGAAQTKRASAGKLGLAVATAVIGASAIIGTPAFADSTTMKLIQMMHQNGSITDAQYNELVQSMRQQASQAAARASTTPANASSSGTLANTNGNKSNSIESTSGTGFGQKVQQELDKVSWADKFKLVGDFRLRYEYNSDADALNKVVGKSLGAQNDRTRGRLRYRLGIITAPIDHLEVGAGLASGGSDPRSTNQTFGNDFSSKGINLDYAYAQYDFSHFLGDGLHLSGIGGKFRRGEYLWTPTDAMWDGDINPEGASVHVAKNSGVGDTFLNSGIWVIQDNAGSPGSSDKRNPYLWYAQGGQEFTFNQLFAKVAGTYYGFEQTYTAPGVAPDTVFEYGSGTNTTSQFSVVDIDGSIGEKYSNGKAELIGQYLKNVHKDVNNTEGWAVGIKASSGPWALKYLYVDLDRNVVPDSYPDSDRFDGATGIRAHEVQVNYELNKAIGFDVDYYDSWSKLANVHQNLVQSDVNFKF